MGAAFLPPERRGASRPSRSELRMRMEARDRQSVYRHARCALTAALRRLDVRRIGSYETLALHNAPGGLATR
ncbi:MAG: hypothetical protein D6744_06915 [Planctomycetota bacterium]|nr:MAG: hypothetical protein D6744_06915 [Planctomycetota bacterium]